MNHQKKSLEHKDIRVARITLRQAVIVAAITAVATIFIGWFTISSKDASSKNTITKPSQIKILGVKAENAEPYCQIRIVMNVNGQYYSYPSKAVWAVVGTQMQSEEFPILSNSERIILNFEIFHRLQDGTVSYHSNFVDHKISKTDLPKEDEFSLHLADMEYCRAVLIDSDDHTKFVVSYEIH